MSDMSRNTSQFMYSPNNNTNENIMAYLQKKQNDNFNNSSYISHDNSLNLIPYNSMAQFPIGYQIPNNMNPQYEGGASNYNNLTSNEINLETANEQNTNYEQGHNEENNININEVEDKKEKKKKEKIVEDDPDKLLFGPSKPEKDDEEGEDLSDLSEESNHEKEYNNNLLTQYEKVKRVKNKWKVNLKGCIVQKDQMEYVCGKVHGELEREW